MNHLIKKYIGAIILFTSLLSCKREYSFETEHSKGTIISATPSIPEYPSGIALNNTHTITVQASVTKAGKYSITTDTVNGVYFNASGTFSNTGMQTVTLQGHGTPDTSGICSWAVKYSSSSRNVSVNVYDWWKFEEEGAQYIGRMDSVYIVNVPGDNILLFEGTGDDGADRKMTTAIDIGAMTSPVVGNYSTDMGLFGFFLYEIVDLASGAITQIYESDRSTGVGGTTINLTIDDYNTTTQMLSGTFSGNAVTDLGMLVNITNGHFRAKFHP